MREDAQVVAHKLREPGHFHARRQIVCRLAVLVLPGKPEIHRRFGMSAISKTTISRPSPESVSYLAMAFKFCGRPVPDETQLYFGPMFGPRISF